MTYKLLPNGVLQVEQNLSIPDNPLNRHWQEFQTWLVEDENNIPLPADVPTAGQIAQALEISEAQPIAKTWFSGQAAAIAFVRQTPEQQATQISGMTVAQKDTVLKYLAIAVSMLIKERLL